MRNIFVFSTLVLCLSACQSVRVNSDDPTYDPFEPLNRQVFGFNNSVDRIFLGPVARGYINTVPEPARDGVSNALANFNAPTTFANDVLQAKPQRAAETFTRFLINTTLGLGGLFDVAGAGENGIKPHREDFGQTLGYWGVPSGAYFVAPFLGPTNLRDTVGGITDNVFNPYVWVEFGVSSNLDTYLQAGQTVVTAIDARARLNDSFEALQRQPEPYTALRRAYTNGRATAIRDGQAVDNPYDDLPDFDEFDDFDDLEDGTGLEE
ncbi:MAG: VacJ family lipoprotein [Pseudomonadota bacterium]